MKCFQVVFTIGLTCLFLGKAVALDQPASAYPPEGKGDDLLFQEIPSVYHRVQV